MSETWITFNPYQWFASLSAGFCVVFCLYYAFRIWRHGKVVDHARPSGSAGKGVRYAYTGAMNPLRKESAYLHKATYTAGLLFHAGTLLGFLLFLVLLFGIQVSQPISIILTAVFSISLAGGLGILLKRIRVRRLRTLSSPEDYLANLAVSMFQLALLLSLWYSELHYYLWITAGILFIYIPLGKLRHCVFFFAARYHLGFFYGSRGVWPPEPKPFLQHDKA